MADFCKQCEEKLFGSESADKLHYDIKDDEFIEILCEGCGKIVRVANDGYRIECNTCQFADRGTCNNCYQIEGCTEISGNWLCSNYKRQGE